MPKLVLYVPARRGRQVDRRDLAPEHRSGACVQRIRPAAARHVGEEPQRRARERTPGARDSTAQRRAGTDQQRPGGTCRRARDAGDLRRRRRQDPGDLRCAGRRHLHLRLRRRTGPLPVHDRARGSLPGRARSHLAVAHQPAGSRDESPSPRQRYSRRGTRMGRDVPGRAGGARIVGPRRSADLWRRDPRPDLTAEPRPDECLLRERRSPADHARGQSQRRARKRAPHSRDSTAQRRAGTDQQRAGGRRRRA